MKIKNRRLFTIFTILLISGYALIGVALYQYMHQFAENQNKKKLDQLLLNQRALHLYLEDELKPVIYKLKEDEKLYKGFFDPKVLSFTYIARGIHKNLNTLRDEHNITRIYYKLATDNPRNPLNNATFKELELLNYFRSNPDVEEFSSVIEENNRKYIYYAMPIERSKASCMKCHSTPDKAPSELITQYGNSAGFGEVEGNVRAIISLKMPFDDELSEANEIFYILMGLLTLFIIILFVTILFFMRKLDYSQQIIEEKNQSLSILAERDGLTDLYNRRSFDTDLNNYINRPNLALIIFDIDYFKSINDQYGHQIGDNVLKTLSELIRSNLREEDHLYRIGGEEFAILTDTQIEDIEQLVMRLLYRVAHHDFGLSEAVHISAGIALKMVDDTTTILYKRADDALYQAKEEGRNRYLIG